MGLVRSHNKYEKNAKKEKLLTFKPAQNEIVVSWPTPSWMNCAPSKMGLVHSWGLGHSSQLKIQRKNLGSALRVS
jgi:hypothetical protein